MPVVVRSLRCSRACSRALPARMLARGESSRHTELGKLWARFEGTWRGLGMTDRGDSGATTSPSRAAAGGNGFEYRELDVLDRQIIRILQKTGRKTNTDIARELSVTETTVRKRIAQLVDDDMI